MSELWSKFNEEYEVSNDGKVRSLKYNKKRILSQSKNPEGYCFVKLYINGSKKMVAVHRLVAYAFIPNPNNYKYINHKDENKSNNNFTNLEWCSSSYNRVFRNIKQKRLEKYKKRQTKNVKVYKFDIYGNFIKEYKTITEASKENNISATGIYRCINNISKQSGGFIWKTQLSQR